ncbi:MAG: hypothetical protein WCF23_05150 [Candidatus Nitrosopolaris sp.]
MSLGEYFSARCLIPINVVLNHISTICRKLTIFDHTVVVVLEKIMVYASFAAPVYGSTNYITAQAETPNKI